MEHKSEQKLVIYWNTKKIVSLICAILLVPTIIVFIFTLALKQTLINPEYYKSNFKKADVSNRLIQEGIPSLILESSIDQNKLKDAFAKDLIVLVIQKSIDPTWIDNLLDKTVDQIVVFFSDANKAGGKIDVNLTDTKSLLAKVSGGLLILEQVVPPCSQIQIADCQKINLDEVKTEIAKTRTAIDNINVGIVDIRDEVEQANSYILALQKLIHQINTAFYISLILLILFILVILFLNLKSLGFVGKSIAISLTIASVLSFIIILPIRSLSLDNINLISFNLPDAMNEIVIDVLRTNIAGIFSRLELITGIILAIGVLKYFGTILLEKYKVIKNI